MRRDAVRRKPPIVPGWLGGLVAAFLAAVLASTAEAATLTVCASGCTFTTVQSAVNAAADGDLIAIGAGRFVENVVISGKSLALRGTGPRSTMIDGGGTGRAVSITGIFGTTTVSLSDLTITGGRTQDFGAGIFCEAGALTIARTLIVNNASQQSGGGLYTNCEQTTVSSSVIAHNAAVDVSALGGGGGIFAVSGVTISMMSSTVAGNESGTDGGGLLGREVLLAVSGSTVAQNATRRFGGGIKIDNGTLSLAGSNVVGNHAGQDGGGVYNFGSMISVQNSVLRGNAPNDCAGCP